MSTHPEPKAQVETRQTASAPSDTKQAMNVCVPTIKLKKPRPEINPLQRLLDLSA